MTTFTHSNTDLINYLSTTGVITSKEVAGVMNAVDRGDYAPHNPYQDKPQYIGYQATISAPHMHAYALVNSLFSPKILLSFKGTSQRPPPSWDQKLRCRLWQWVPNSLLRQNDAKP